MIRTLCTLLALLVLSPTWGDSYPSKPITVVVPFPGGGTDLLIRTISTYLSKDLGQPVVIENRSGAGGTLGSALVAKARPDGYMIGMATTSTLAVAPSLYRNVPYDPLKDFEPIALIGTTPYVLVARPGLPAKSVKELVALARAQPGKLTYVSVGSGTLSHLIAEQFKSLAGIDLVHVPYKGSAPAQTDLLGGQVDLLFDNPVVLVQHVRAGKMRALALTRSDPLLPEVPLFSAQGVPALDAELWYGLVAPASTPEQIVARLHQALSKTLQRSDIQADLAAKGIAVTTGGREHFASVLKNDVAKWGQLVRRLGLRVD